MSLILVAVASGVAVWYYRQAVVWTPLQQFYLSAYARSALANSLGIQTGRYRVLAIVNRHGTRLAIDDEVIPVLTASVDHRRARCVHPGAAARHSERPRAGTGAPPRPPPEGAGAGVGAAVQSAHARRRRALCPGDQPCGGGAWAEARHRD